jgi:hypothetical protein
VVRPKNPKPARAGEGPGEAVINDQTDLREGAEEMRPRLGYLYPEARERWQVRETLPPQPGNAYPGQGTPLLSVKRERPGADSARVTLVDAGGAFHSARSTVVQAYDPADDVLAAPLPKDLPFLRAHTSDAAVDKLNRAAITLFDDYVHDSHCGFRVPYFHEYASGGYGWPSVVFAGGGAQPLSDAYADPAAAGRGCAGSSRIRIRTLNGIPLSLEFSALRPDRRRGALPLDP